MKTEQILGREFNIPENWYDVSIYKYTQLLELRSKRTQMLNGVETLTVFPEQWMVEYCATLLDVSTKFFYDSYIDDETIQRLVEIMKPFNVSIPIEKADFFRINGNLYSYNVPDKLTFGEQISNKFLESKSETMYDTWLNLLTILIRPAQEITNKEFGNTEYIVSEFDGDNEVLLKRRELFKNIPAPNGYWIVKSFMNGRKK